MSNSIMYDPDKYTTTDGATLAKDIFRTKDPYYIDRRPDGKQPIFSEHFLEAFAKALSFNCIADMTKKEKDLYFEYVNWTADKEYYDISSFKDGDLVFKALDTWATDELFGNEHPTIAVCS